MTARSLLLPAPEDRRASAAARMRWRDARLFQIHVQQLLASEQVTFMQWLLLETIQELRDETRAAASQIAIAERAGLTRMVVSYWMIVMDEDALVDRGPDADGRAYRVLLTSLGERTLQRCNELLEAAGLTG